MTISQTQMIQFFGCDRLKSRCANGKELMYADRPICGDLYHDASRGYYRPH